MQSKIKLTALATALCACGFVNAQSAAPSVTVFGIVDAGISSTTNTGNGSQTIIGAGGRTYGCAGLASRGNGRRNVAYPDQGDQHRACRGHA